MDSQLIIDVRPKEVAMALLEDRKLVEFQREKSNSSCAVGDIYLGKVRKIMPGLNAAFVDIGSGQDAFLHYYDLGMEFGATENYLKMIAQGRNLPPLTKVAPGVSLPREGKIENVLSAGQTLLVQVTKEPISTKGARLSTTLSLAGRSMVLFPFGNKVSVSKKISSKEESKRLKSLIQSIKPEGFTVVIRTSAIGKKALELHAELNRLVNRWNDSVKKLPRAKAPALICAEPNRALSLLRDTFSAATYTEIAINDKDMYGAIKDYISTIAPDSTDIVSYYDNSKPIFDHYDVTRQVKSLFGRTVTYKGGAYLIIEKTEAMHVVDVNSGNRSRKSNAQEDTALDVNLSAAEELARQLRLRDMGGIIVVDFIDMNDPQHCKQLYDHMRALMKTDRAKHNILPLSKFCVMQMTRQRVREATTEHTEETCPTCMGTGKMQASILLVEQIEKKVADLIENHNVRQCNLHVNPYVAAYLQRHEIFSPSEFSRWRKKYSRGLKLVEDQSIAFLDYKFYDKEGNDLDVFDD